MVTKTKRVNLSSAAEKLHQLADDMTELGIHPSVLNAAAIALQSHCENLPIHWEGVKDRFVMGFVLACSEWWPVHAMLEIWEGPCRGGINYRIDYQDGAVESGVALRYRWAHCTADNTVNYHWLDPVEEPEVVEQSEKE